MCSLQELIQRLSVMARHLFVRALGGDAWYRSGFAVFREYKLMPGVTPLKAVELSWEAELFLPYVKSVFVGYVDSRELEARGSQAACVVTIKDIIL